MITIGLATCRKKRGILTSRNPAPNDEFPRIRKFLGVTGDTPMNEKLITCVTKFGLNDGLGS